MPVTREGGRPTNLAQFSSNGLIEEDDKTYDLPCMICRRRKVRCSKTWPCSNCQRSGAECSFEEPSNLAIKRNSKIAELSDRLAKMEALVRELSNKAPDQEDHAHAISGSTLKSLAQSFHNGLERKPPVDTTPPSSGRLVYDNGHSRYLQIGFWANWHDEV